MRIDATDDWLRTFAPGFQALSEIERKSISDFPILWSLFEGKVLNGRGSARAITDATARWFESGKLTSDTFGQELFYFRNRYTEGGVFSDHFDHLHLRANDAPDLVREVLLGNDTVPQNAASAVLIIIYRFRNNLFHGIKWNYDFQRQLENFRCSNTALMRAIELHENTST